MADKHPYISGPGNLVRAVQQFRTSLPPKIDAGILKKLGIAPNNESYLINILRFLKIIEEDGVPTKEGRAAFTQHDDEAFGTKLGEMIERAYFELFSLHKEQAWQLDGNALITYFRQSDQTSSLVGGRQAATFQTLAALAGHGDLPNSRPSSARKGKPAAGIKTPKVARKSKADRVANPKEDGEGKPKDLGLTVRIEINLPTAEDQAVYDRIFRSIRENLLHG